MSALGTNRWLLPIAVFCTAALTGWWQVNLTEVPADADRAAVPTRSNRPARPSLQTSRKDVPDHVRRLLAPLRAARTPEERQRAAIHLALALPVAELAAWYDAKWYPAGDGMDSVVFYGITRQRWLDEDPAGYLNHALVKQLSDTYSAGAQWTSRDPEAALKWLHDLTDPRDFNRMAGTVYRNLAKVRPALALAEILQVQRRIGVADGTVDAMLESLADNSADALQKAVSNWPTELSQLANRALMRGLLKRDFAAGIAELRGRSDGRAHFLHALGRNPNLGIALLDQVEALPSGWFAGVVEQGSIYSMIGDYPARWLEKDLAALGLGEESANEFRSIALSVLAAKDPAAAFTALEKSELNPQLRQGTWDSIFRQLARKNPTAARAMMTQLSNPDAIARCEQALAPPKPDGQLPKPPTPTEWLTNLAKPEPDPRMYVPSDIWDRSAIAEARSCFAQLPDDQKARAARDISMEIAGSNMGNAMTELQADAFRWMLENPSATPNSWVGPSSEVRLLRSASDLAATWAQDDPQAASRWATTLPPGETRLWVMKNVARQWAEYQPSAAAAWAKSLPPSERAEVVAHLSSGK